VAARRGHGRLAGGTGTVTPKEATVPERRPDQLALLEEPGPATTTSGRRLLERRRAVGVAAALAEYVERQERQEQPCRTSGG